MADHTRTPNKLLEATSPYLLQHAYNPVSWVQWDAEALARARREDKPILVSIGYSSCHWCHVMERECFEKEEIAAVMNAYFVCIKVDREERPDIDQIYMEAVQAMGGHGGWPLNVFLTPDQKPFYGGTYFPPDRWVSLLRQISATFIQKRPELEENAEQLTRHISVSDLSRFTTSTSEENFSKEDAAPLFAVLSDRFDTVWGGLEKAPKFVMPTLWLFLLRYHALTKNPDALAMVRHTLTKMQHGGLYDQLGGGFSRYSVDGQWFAPHFEKMLYDNAQLLSLYSEAYAWTRDASFKKVVEETIAWLKKEMRHPEGGFYSALDADSEGIEGKFYAWTWDELQEVLGNDTQVVADFFGCTQEGNWEHGRNILKDTSLGELPPAIVRAKEKLLRQRETRIRPGLDDKILAGWNAMTVTGLIAAYQAFGEAEFLALAENGILFIERRLISNGKLWRSFKDKSSPTEGFLEDYALLIEAYTALYQATFTERYLSQATHWCGYVLDNFIDGHDGYFHFTGNQADVLIARKKELFDNVIPGSNSIMARNLYRLGILLDDARWKQKAVSLIQPLKNMMQKEPGYLSNWGILMTEMAQGMAEVVITGPEAELRRKEFAAKAAPFTLVMGASGTSSLVLLEGRTSADLTRIFVCYDKTCQLPVTSVDEALAQLKF